MSFQFRIKICGITRPEDAQAAVQGGADAIGLNFYSRSSRYVFPEIAQEITVAVDPAVLKIGVFVNSTAEQIDQIVQQVGLDAVQLHGDEPPELLGELDPNRPVVRARRLGPAGLVEIAEDLKRCQQHGRCPSAVLLDAAVAGQYGGTGEQLPWDQLREYKSCLRDTPLVLAGGLTPENVSEAIATVQPMAVDVASGVESFPGVKSSEKLRLFLQRAKSAFDSL